MAKTNRKKEEWKERPAGIYDDDFRGTSINFGKSENELDSMKAGKGPDMRYEDISSDKLEAGVVIQAKDTTPKEKSGMDK